LGVRHILGIILWGSVEVGCQTPSRKVGDTEKPVKEIPVIVFSFPHIAISYFDLLPVWSFTCPFLFG